MTTRDVETAARLMVQSWGERIARRRATLPRNCDTFQCPSTRRHVDLPHDGKPWSQVDLAVILATNQQQVSKWEHGLQEPRLATKYAIAEALRCRPEELFPLMP